MYLLKVLWISCLFLALGCEAKRHKSWGKRGGGHPLRDHLYPKWNSYDEFVAPSTVNDVPVKVEVNMFLREVGPLNQADKSFRIQVTLRQVFNDSRLAWKSNRNSPDMVTLIGEEMNNIWMPDTFVRNERSTIFHDSLKPNVYARIYPDGKVQTSQRVTLELSCPNLQKDLDLNKEAVCNVDIASYAYTTSDLAYEWQKQNPIQLVKWSKEFINDGIELDSHELSTCDVTTSTGQYSCIRLGLKFKKKDEDAPVIPYDDIYDNYDYSY